MIGSPDLFRSWKEVGTDGLSEIERFTRSEYPDGDRLLFRQAAATGAPRDATILRRLASALHLVRAPVRVPAATRAAGIHPGIAAVHFAREPEARAELHVPREPETVLFVACPDDCGHLPIECDES